MAILDEVKTRLRISAANTAYDSDITALIAEARADMIRVGVDPGIAASENAIVKRAITAYCRGRFDIDGRDLTAAWRDVYQSDLRELALMNGGEDADVE